MRISFQKSALFFSGQKIFLDMKGFFISENIMLLDAVTGSSETQSLAVLDFKKSEALGICLQLIYHSERTSVHHNSILMICNHKYEFFKFFGLRIMIAWA